MKNQSFLLILAVVLFWSANLYSQKKINLVKGLPEKKIEKINLGKNINSDKSEYVPVISPDGKTLYMFVLGDTKNIGEGDIWYSTKLSDISWSPRKNIGEPLNNEASNFVISVSPDNNTLFLSRKYKARGKNIVDNGEGFSITRRTKTGWSMPQDVVVEGFKNKNKYGEFCMSTDQKTLVHAIEMSDSKGDQDLYVSFRKADGTWTRPKTLDLLSILQKPKILLF
jgi:hypothetical protein